MLLLTKIIVFLFFLAIGLYIFLWLVSQGFMARAPESGLEGLRTLHGRK